VEEEKQIMTKKKAPVETITEFTAATCEVLRNKMITALQAVEQDMGVKIMVGKMSYDINRVDVKVNAETSNALEANFNRYHDAYGFKKEDLGRSFVSPVSNKRGARFGDYTFLGLDAKSNAVCSLAPTGKHVTFRGACLVSLLLGNNPYALTPHSSYLSLYNLTTEDIGKQITATLPTRSSQSYTFLGLDATTRKRQLCVVLQPVGGEIESFYAHTVMPDVLKAFGRTKKPYIPAA